MPYYKFDIKVTNQPPGGENIDFEMAFAPSGAVDSENVLYDEMAGGFALTYDTSAVEWPYELNPTDEFYLTLYVYNIANDLLSIKLAGPYIVGEVGIEVPEPEPV